MVSLEDFTKMSISLVLTLGVVMSRPCVLLVEDNADLAEAMIEYLEDSTGFQFIHFKSGKPALAYLEDRPHSVVGILSDLMMKDMDGIDFLGRIRKNAKLSQLPFIFVSGTDPNVFGNLLKREDYQAFVQKPLDFNKLEKLMVQFFGSPAGSDSKKSA